MQITIDAPFLIERAKSQSGLTLGQMAEDLAINQSRISEWKKGKYQPDASEIAYFADKAGLPVLEVVAEMEAVRRPALAAIWNKALRAATKS